MMDKTEYTVDSNRLKRRKLLDCPGTDHKQLFSCKNLSVRWNIYRNPERSRPVCKAEIQSDFALGRRPTFLTDTWYALVQVA